MASTSPPRPIPLPPRTPTPPPDDDEGLERFENSPPKSAYDSSCLSPMDENFSLNRYGPTPGFHTTTLPLSTSDSNSMYSPMSVDSNGSVGSTTLVEDTKGVFNFHPAPLAKAPVARSV